ncbi:peptide-binding protein [Ignavibacteria bacterium]|nr:hypothetical protein [Bacteroidota bacterium]MCZ2133624.1 ABC transporter substrate-binding protein [Bacteroidota bacterium]
MKVQLVQHRIKFYGAAIAAAAVLLLIGCSGKRNDTTIEFDKNKPERGDWVVVHDLSDPNGLNPITTSDAGASNIFRRIFEPLLDIDFATTELRPNIASKMPDISDDHLTYTFSIHKNITFSDGKPLTANDVIFTFKALKNPLIAEGAAVRNYVEDIEDAVKLDDYTVKFTMRKPYFLADYAIGNTVGILPKHKLDPKGLTDLYTFAETNDFERAKANASMQEFATWFGKPECSRSPELLIGSGPYILEEWNTGQNIRLKRNEKYWNAGNNPNMMQYPDKIIYKTIPDRPTAVTEVKNGDVDFMEYVPPKLYVNSIDAEKIRTIVKGEFTTSVYMYIGWNMRRSVFADKRTRQAMSYMVDRNKLIQSVVLGFGKITNSPVYSDRPEYDKSLVPYDYNPNKARQLLAEAGWSDSDGDGQLDKVVNGKKTNFTFSMMVNIGNEIRNNIALLLADELKKIGITMTVSPTDWSVFQQNARMGEFDSYIGAWVNDPMPTDPYQLWHSSQATNQGSNYCGFMNKRADQLIEMNRLEFDQQKRNVLMKEFQEIVHDEQPYTFLWSAVNPAVYAARLQGVKFYSARPGYNPGEWWIPKQLRKYTKD